MPINWTEDQKLLRETVRKLALEKFPPKAVEINQQAAFPWENVKVMAELGLFGLVVPEEYGGSGMKM
jgi:alkylation response protein AidB-like acyl-CoA dehydrogenase